MTDIEKTLRESEKKYKELSKEYELILDNFPGLVFLKDTKNNFLRVNQKVVDSYNANIQTGNPLLSKEDLEGKSLSDLMSKDEAQRYFDDDLQVIKGEVPQLNIEESYESEEGIIWLSTSKIPLINDKGEITGIIGISMDITKKKLAEQELKDSKEEYRRAYERETFYKDLFTHDINNILHNILTSLAIIDIEIEHAEITEGMKKMLDVIRNQVDRGASLANNVNKFSQVEESNKRLEKINGSAVLNEAIDYIVKSFKNKQLRIQLETQEGVIFLQANEFLKDVFENILINAIKHNDNEFIEITIKISKISENNCKFIKYEFIDNAKGIPKSKRESIFKRGYKEDRSVSGLGIGLSLVRNILDNYGAKIVLENRIPEDYTKGTNFTILFPEVY